ncbi:hypothetical protein M0804_012281 [Polistes exclamans]|nr:hypothetical protein M0804_012281 [Polistes exclamans]
MVFRKRDALSRWGNVPNTDPMIWRDVLLVIVVDDDDYDDNNNNDDDGDGDGGDSCGSSDGDGMTTVLTLTSNIDSIARLLEST